MKRTIIIILSHIIFYGSYAQIQSLSTNLIKTQNQFEKKIYPKPLQKGAHEAYLDYYYAENSFHGGPIDTGGNYGSYIWLMNMNYELGLGDTLINYCVVAFDSLYDPYADITYDKNDIINISVDTIWLEFGHENNSGIADTLRIKIIPLYNSGFPNENSVIWSTDIIGTSLTDTNQFNWTSLITVVPSQNLGSVKEFGVVLEYYGNRIDSAGFVAGYGNKGSCPALGLTTSAMKSNFYPNSYSLIMHYGPFGIIPTILGNDIYYDCNSDGDYTEGIDGENFIQDINIWCKVTITNTIGMDEIISGNVSLFQNYPNPVKNKTSITYHLNSNTKIKLQIHDVTGRLVFETDEGQKSAGQHIIQLNASQVHAGIYYYTLITDENQLSRRMIIR